MVVRILCGFGTGPHLIEALSFVLQTLQSFCGMKARLSLAGERQVVERDEI